MRRKIENGKVVKYIRLDYFSNLEVETAKELDSLIVNKLKEILEKLKQAGLLDNKKHDLAFWYIIGKGVNELIESDEFKKLGIPKYDLKGVFEGIENAARIELHIFENLKESKRQNTFLRNHIYRAYKLAQFPEEYVKKVGSWDTWREFLERPIFDRDPILLRKLLDSYLKKYNKPIERKTAREIIKLVNKKLKGYNTKYMPNDVLDKIIEEIINTVG
ncbi:MAG: hypothetical protein RXR31_00770 [Thermoproteota archaeon]